MTKRFIYDGLHIRDLHCKIPPILTNNDKIRDKYLNELNELHEEKERLKKENEDLQDEVYILQDDILNKRVRNLIKENEQLKQQLFETSNELLWATSDEVDRALHYEDEVGELRKEIFE